jgi:hypothetical protein
MGYAERYRMSEEKTKEELQQEYVNLCAVVGDLSFRQRLMEADLTKHMQTLVELSKKAKDIKPTESSGEQT